MTNLPRPEDVAARPGLNTPPRRPATAFAGRDEELRQLREALSRPASVVITQAREGLGGVGTTELALRYADVCRDRYRLTGWITADTAESIGAGLVALAARIEPRIGTGVRTPVAIEWALCWLRIHHNWLLVLDNAEDVGLVEPLIGQLGTGHIVITSHRDDWCRPATAIKLDVLSPDAAIDLLLRAIGATGATSATGATGPVEREAAARIAAELGCLPLALAHAAAYIRATETGLPRYLELLGERPAHMYATAPEAGEAQCNVARVWDITRSAIEARDPRAVRLLYVLAWYAQADIPRELIGPGEDDSAVDEALDLLASYGIISRAAENTGRGASTPSVVVHRLVRSVLLTDPANAERDAPAGRDAALDWLVRAIPIAPDSNVAGWPLWRELTPHVEPLARHYDNSAKPGSLGVLLTETARFHMAQAAYAQALACGERALAVTEAALGPDHLDVATALASLAFTYRMLGQVTEALPLQERALAITERALGSDHPDVASALENLARYYRMLGKMAAALPLAARALAITERSLGRDHPAVASALGNLAGANRELGRVAEALPLARRALVITETAHGPDHPDVASALTNLALTFKGLGRTTDALPLEERALTITEEALGADHPDLAVRLGNLASTYSGLGRAADALPLEERALAITEAALGTEHPHVATALGNLASTYSELGRVDDALPLEERALAITEEALGAQHPHVATAMGNLALTCKALGLVGEALPLEERALAITEDALGAYHPDVAIRLGNLAGTYRTLGWADESLPLERQALAITEGAFGAHHPDVATALGNLASSYSELGLATDALALEERALAITEKVLGPDHPDVAIRLGNLAFTYSQLGRAADAQAGARRAYACARASLGGSHPTTEWAWQLCSDLGLDPDRD